MRKAKLWVPPISVLYVTVVHKFLLSCICISKRSYARTFNIDIMIESSMLYLLLSSHAVIGHVAASKRRYLDIVSKYDHHSASRTHPVKMHHRISLEISLKIQFIRSFCSASLNGMWTFVNAE
jgi:hypothetical protein